MPVFFIIVLSAGAVSAKVNLADLSGSWPTATRNVAGFIIVFFIVVISVVALFEALKILNKTAAEKRASREAFTDLVKKFALNTAEITLLKQAVLNSGLTDAELIFRNIEYFEIGIGRELEKCKKNPALLRNVCDTVSSARHKLNFQKIPAGARYYSSRELPVGQPVTLRIPDIAPDDKIQAAIVEITELSITAECADNKTAPPDLRSGGLLQVSLFKQGEAEYSFQAAILRISTDLKRITFDHVIEMNRRQVRGHVRIEINNQANFRILKSPTAPEKAKGAARHSGMVTDISGGGLSLQTENPLSAGDVVLLSFPLRGNALHGIRGVVLRSFVKEKNGDPVFENHVEYDGIENTVKEKIIRLIFEMQREELQWQK